MSDLVGARSDWELEAGAAMVVMDDAGTCVAKGGVMPVLVVDWGHPRAKRLTEAAISLEEGVL